MSLSKRNVGVQTIAYIFKGVLFHQVADIDIESIQNRLLKVCYVPATRASLPRVSFFFSFLFLLLQPLIVLMKQTRQAVCAVKQSIFLDVYGSRGEDEIKAYCVFFFSQV